MVNFYKELVALILHCYFPYESGSKNITMLAENKLAEINNTGTEVQKSQATESDFGDNKMEKNYII